MAEAIKYDMSGTARRMSALVKLRAAGITAHEDPTSSTTPRLVFLTDGDERVARAHQIILAADADARRVQTHETAPPAEADGAARREAD